MNETVEKDIYQKNLEEKSRFLKECQESKGFKSCLNCEDIFTCEIRKKYVISAHQSMSKGDGGGFEF
ncbi:MAG: hypothetical protein PHW07_01705 [Sulfurospirillaceae bacterium]|nr:hypothetical protein [Sulfurospirillaceae bacterium]